MKRKLFCLCLIACSALFGGARARADIIPPPAQLFEGRVYARTATAESYPMAGVTVALYGANNPHPAAGVLLETATTDANGYYALLLAGEDQVYEYYSLRETDPAGYVSVEAETVSGVVRTANWIEFFIPLQGKDLTGNIFRDDGLDLTIDRLDVEPGRALPGEEVTFTAWVRSFGPSPFTNVPVRFFANGEPFASGVIPTLPISSVAGVSVTGAFTGVTYYTVSAEVNPEHSLPETDPNNNLATSALELVWEKDPPWSKPDLALSNLAVAPQRPNAGAGVEVAVDLTLFNGLDRPVTVALFVDQVVVHELPPVALDPGAVRRLNLLWPSATPGRHLLQVIADPEQQIYERQEFNNRLETWVRVAGEADPLPDFAAPSIELAQTPVDGEPALIDVTVENAGYAGASQVPVLITVDGHPLAQRTLDSLGPGERTTFGVNWNDVGQGEHLIGVWIDPDDVIADDSLGIVTVQRVLVPGAAYVLPPAVTPANWTFLGPDSINNDAYVGRIDAIDLSHQARDTIVVGAPAGGVWVTTSAGADWIARGDLLDFPGYPVVKFDPANDQIIYAGSGSTLNRDGVGLYKSVDFGAHWSKFADTWLGRGFAGLIVRDAGGGQVTLYAATDTGVWRWQGSRTATLSTANQWTQLWQQQTTGDLTSQVVDMLLTTQNPPQLYIAIYKDGVYRASLNDLATPPFQSDWTRLAGGMPADPVSIRLGHSAANAGRVYAAVKRATGDLEIYRRDFSGNWVYRSRPTDTYGKSAPYNAYIAVSPSNADLVFIGGVKGWRSADGGLTFPYQLPGPSVVHDDYKAMAFDLTDPSVTFYVSDGGVYRCTNSAGAMACVGRNQGLATTMFYDIAAAKTKPVRILGGTQDNGTILTDGTLEWKNLGAAGDGRYVAIDPTQANTMYAQYQYTTPFLKTTTGSGPWSHKNTGLPTGGVDAFLAIHPSNGQVLLLAAEQVYRTTNGADAWSAIGPSTAVSQSSVKRLVIDGANNRYYAGMNNGRIYAVRGNDVGGDKWSLVYTHPLGHHVRSLLMDPSNAEIVYATFAGASTTRIVRLTHSGGWPGSWAVANLTGTAPDDPLAARNLAGPAGGGGQWDIVRGLLKDPKAEVLYVGTDRGVYRGEPINGVWQWYADSCGLPRTYISDLELDATQTLMRAATYGRSAYERPLTEFAGDAYDTTTHNDTLSTAAALGVIQNTTPLMAGLLAEDLTLHRSNDVDFFTLQLPPVQANECFASGDSKLTTTGCSQCTLDVDVLAPDTPYPFRIALYRPDGTLLKDNEKTSSSELGLTLVRPREIFASGVVSLSVRSPNGCRGKYSLVASYNPAYCVKDPPKLLTDPPLFKHIVPELPDFVDIFPGDPGLIRKGYVDAGVELPEQRVVFYWDSAQDLNATIGIGGQGRLDVVLYNANGQVIATAQPGQAAAAVAGVPAAAKELAVAALPAGWYALGIRDGDFPTFFSVDVAHDLEISLHLPLLTRP